MSLIAIENGSMSASVESCLDEKFQEEWLIPKGFMTVAEEGIDSIDTRDNFISTPARFKILKELGDHNRRMVAKTKLARLLSKGKDGREELHWMHSLMTRLNNSIEKGQIYMGSKAMGYGLGVQSFTLLPRDLILMRCLWEELGNWVPTKRIVERTGFSRGATINRVMEWRKREDYNTTYRVESKHASRLGYCLLDLESICQEELAS